jgi:hypothetical protein
LTDVTLIEDQFRAQLRVPPERVAWGVLLIAFAVFCMVCIGSTLWLHYFAFESSISLDTTLHVGRGTVGIVENNSAPQAENAERSLGGQTVVQTDRLDPWSQAVITFDDPKHRADRLMLATLKSDTSVRVGRAVRPRFDWSSRAFEINLSDLQGEIDIILNPVGDRDVQVSIFGISGDEVRLISAGQFTIFASETQMRIINIDGEVVLITQDGNQAYSIPREQRGVFDAETDQLINTPDLNNLLTNGELEIAQIPQSDRQRVIDLPPLGWECTYGPPNNLPFASYFQAQAPDGRDAFRLVRESADTNGFSRCGQTFGDGLDVSAYDHLSLQARFFVEYQSLNGCGQVATECPVMLSIEYKLAADSDDELEWLHGVFTRPLAPQQEEQGWIQQCSSCLQPHVQIYEDTWYTYESGNLFDVIPDTRRPVIITKVEFFAEGHEFDVYFDEIALYARNATLVTPEDTTLD